MTSEVPMRLPRRGPAGTARSKWARSWPDAIFQKRIAGPSRTGDHGGASILPQPDTTDLR